LFWVDRKVYREKPLIDSSMIARGETKDPNKRTVMGEKRTWWEEVSNQTEKD